MACSKPSSATSTGSSSNTTFCPFWERFILVYIPGRSRIAQRRLIKLKVDRQGRLILHFQDIDEVSLVYCAFKEEDGKTLSRELKKRRDNFLAIAKQQEKQGLLKTVGHGTEDNKEYLKFEVLNTALWQSLKSKFSIQKHSQWTYRSAAAFDGGTSSDTGLGNSQSNEQQSNEAPSSSGENFRGTPLDTQPDDETKAMINQVLSDGLASLDVTSLDQSLHLTDENPRGLAITPNFCDIKGGCTFNMRANQDQPSGKYWVYFGVYGICEALGNGSQYLDGKENIPGATRPGTQWVTVTVIDQHSKIIGRFPFKYVDADTDDCMQELTSQDPNLSGKSNLRNNQLPTKKSSDESTDDAVPSKRSRHINMAMLMYLCDEMAKRGDEDFFSALIKLDILADVLANRSEHFNSFAATAQKHGHTKLADLIVMSSRELSRDCLMEKLTLEKLVDAVRRERLLKNSIYSSDDDSDSCSSGYDGDSDEAEAKEKDVTKRLPRDQNVPMICGPVESSDVGRSEFIDDNEGLDNMDTQEVKTAEVETTSVPTSVEHSTISSHVCDLPGTRSPKCAGSKTLFKTEEERKHQLQLETHFSRFLLWPSPTEIFRVEEDLNEEKESANCVITEQEEQFQDVNEKEDLVDDFITELDPLLERYRRLQERYRSLWAEIMKSQRENYFPPFLLWPSPTEEERKRQLQLENYLSLFHLWPSPRENYFPRFHLWLSFTEQERKRHLQLEMFGNASVLERFKSRGGGWKVILKSPKSGCGKSVVDLTRKRKMTISNSSLSDLNFKDPTIMKQSLAFIRNVLVFIDKLHLQERRHGFRYFTNSLTMCTENRFHELAVVGALDERTEGPGDEVQSTGAKGVTWITLDLARIGDEVVATKVEFVYEAISENDSENTERTDITATASTKNELDDGADLN